MRPALLAITLAACSAPLAPSDAATCSHDAMPLYRYSGWNEHYCDDTSAEYIEREDAFVEARARLGCCLASCCGVDCHAPAEAYRAATSCDGLALLRIP